MTCGDLPATAWRKAKTSLQLSAMVANVSGVTCFALPFFINFRPLPPRRLTVFSIVVVFPTGCFPSLRPLRDGASKNIQELARIRLPVEDCNLREEWQEEDGVARRPVPLLLRLPEVAGGRAMENLRDRVKDLVVVCGKSNVHLDGNNRR